MKPVIELVGLSSTVLVVDDEDSVVSLFEKALPRRGLKVKPALNGEQALELLNTTSFGCILVDKNLPDIDGLSVMREARRLQPYCACIVMTGYSSTASAVEALRLGATDYLEKPFDNLDLVTQKVDRAIRARRSEYERDALFERVKGFEAELARQNEQVQRQHGELEMLNKLLEVRVREATEDLQKKCEILEACIHGKDADGDYALRVHAESILEFIQGIHLEDSDPVGIARAAITRLQRRLESHLELIRRMCDGEKPEQKKGA